jgi:hypothetical protein
MLSQNLHWRLIGVVLAVLFLAGCGARISTPEPPTSTQILTATQEPPKSISEVPRISAEEIKERLDNREDILIVDSRANSLFETRHIAGAISVPESEVESRLDEFPRDQDIVFY